MWRLYNRHRCLVWYLASCVVYLFGWERKKHFSRYNDDDDVGDDCGDDELVGHTLYSHHKFTKYIYTHAQNNGTINRLHAAGAATKVGVEVVRLGLTRLRVCLVRSCELIHSFIHSLVASLSSLPSPLMSLKVSIYTYTYTHICVTESSVSYVYETIFVCMLVSVHVWIVVVDFWLWLLIAAQNEYTQKAEYTLLW